MTTLQLAAGAGCLIGLGTALILWRLAPAHPHLGSALERLDPVRAMPVEHGDEDRRGRK